MKNSIKGLVIILGLSLVIMSCKYQKIADAKYPDQILYMPAAKQGIYEVKAPADTYEDPTPGSPYTYYIDSVNNQIIIPLGIYRAGVSNKGNISVNIIPNTDTVMDLISSGQLSGVKLLPSKKYSIPKIVNIKNGMDHVTFNVNIDFSFIQQNPGEKYALGVEVSSNQLKVNMDLNTTIVLIDPKNIK